MYTPKSKTDTDCFVYVYLLLGIACAKESRVVFVGAIGE